MTILDILDNKVIPWVRAQGRHRLIVADESLPRQSLPEGMRITERELRGQRLPLRGTREYSSRCNVVARWPEDGLHERLLPFITCVVSGVAEIQVGHWLIHCTEGHFLLLPSRAPHSIGDPKHPIPASQVPDLMAFETWDDRLQCGLGYSVGTNLYSSNTALIQLLDMLINEALGQDRENDAIVPDMFSAFLGVLRRDLSSGRWYGQKSVELNSADQHIHADPIQRVQRYTRSHLAQPLSTSEAAAMALMSRSQFIKRFREVSGQSYGEYLTRCRIEESKMLLRETTLSIAAIHKFVGLKDATRLRDIFKERVGMSPVEFRQYSRKAEGDFT